MQTIQKQFKLHSEYAPTGDQPQAIKELVEGFKKGNQFQTLLGVTGSGKTFTMANVIAALNKPTLIIAHNKTLAGQLYGEFKEFFPENAVEYFVSYYDYYQPEAYVPSTDTYIAKDSSINDEIDKLRLSATASLSERKDVIVVASVSCIYGLGSPEEYQSMIVSLRPGQMKDRDQVLRELIDIQYTRNDLDVGRGTFRVRGDVVEVYPAEGGDYLIRVEFFGDEIDRIAEVDPLTGKMHRSLEHVAIFPASHYVIPQEKINKACEAIEKECEEQIRFFKSEDKLIEAQRISERTNFDVEMLRETGFCSGIENYSRHMNGAEPGTPPYCLMDFFKDDYLIIVDESHITIPQVRGMYAGDRSRKTTLVDYGFRLPSALDNRPLNFEEFEGKIDQMLFVSATPGEYEATITYHSDIGDIQTKYKYVVVESYLDRKFELVFNKELTHYDMTKGFTDGSYKVVYTDTIGKQHIIKEYDIVYDLDFVTVTFLDPNGYYGRETLTYKWQIPENIAVAGKCENLVIKQLDDGNIKISLDCPYLPENGTMLYDFTYPAEKKGWITVHKHIESNTPEVIIDKNLILPDQDNYWFCVYVYIVDDETNEKYQVLKEYVYLD